MRFVERTGFGRRGFTPFYIDACASINLGRTPFHIKVPRSDFEGHTHHSLYLVMYDIFNECARFNVLDLVCDMMRDILPIMSKQRWSKLVWQRAWMIEDAYWASANMISKEK